MNAKRQSRNYLLNILAHAAAAALAIAVIFALTVVLTQSAQAQIPASGGGWTEQVLYSFGNRSGGSIPSASLIFDAAGNLYGTTGGGGTYYRGTVFELTPTVGGGWTEEVLHNFNYPGPHGPTAGWDGSAPYAGVIFDAAGSLYGTTSSGGIYGQGTVFELTPTEGGGWAEKVLYGFTNGTDGASPEASLIFDARSNLYGTTQIGGTYDGGTVFELTPAAGGRWTEQILHSFNPNNSADGWDPYAGLIFDAAGNLYGTTGYGGTYGGGTVFELTPTAGGGWMEHVLYNFGNGTDGIYPYASLIFDTAGNLYGTTQQGGTYSVGTVFALTPTAGGGWTEKVLYSFCSQPDCTDGADPSAGLIFDVAGSLYSTTYYGGSYGPYGGGTVFELTPEAGGSWTEQVLYSFPTTGTDASHPDAGLIFDAVGNLYGTTYYGGTSGWGTVFELMPD